MHLFPLAALCLLLLAPLATPDWAGRYTFFETTNEEDGASPFWGYDLTLTRDGDRYTGTLHIDGTQTMSRYRVAATTIAGDLAIVLVGYGPENVFEPYEPGAVLFWLTPQDSGPPLTTWEALSPRTWDPSLSGVAFELEE